MRLVLDTNIWLDWLVFEDTGLARIRQLQAAKHLEICIDAACEAELAKVLAYPLGKRQLSAAEQGTALAQCRRIAVRVDVVAPAAERARLPACRDPDDQKFLEAALAVRADWLITKDRALLELERRRSRPVPFRIAVPDDFG
jgi:putative PIN family toxin of toxin-antitoxin system